MASKRWRVRGAKSATRPSMKAANLATDFAGMAIKQLGLEKARKSLFLTVPEGMPVEPRSDPVD